jgi:lincosamide nucleotidyltransferase A/C/D/E
LEKRKRFQIATSLYRLAGKRASCFLVSGGKRIMMTENYVIDLLKKVDHIGIEIWIDGGWGVDALLGRQTRPHNDIDVFVQKKDHATFTEMLISNGYKEAKVEFTTDDHTAWIDSENHIIDLHLFEFAKTGTVYFEDEIYPADILEGKGTIGGIAVRCLTVEAQILYHQGYELKEKDIQDVQLLCETFEFPIPEGFEKCAQRKLCTKTENI